jgi:hypothetical protein
MLSRGVRSPPLEVLPESASQAAEKSAPRAQLGHALPVLPVLVALMALMAPRAWKVRMAWTAKPAPAARE